MPSKAAAEASPCEKDAARITRHRLNARRCHGGVQVFARRLNSRAKLDLGSVWKAFTLQASELYFVAKQTVSEFVKPGRTAPAHRDFSIRSLAPWFQLNQRIGDTFVVRSPLIG